METRIPVPTGISATNPSIRRWFKRVGDPVSIAEPLVEIESDNITVEVLAPATGVSPEISLERRRISDGQFRARIDYRIQERLGCNRENRPARAKQIS